MGCACPQLCHPAAAGGACGLPALQTHPTGATGARAPKDSPSLSSLSWIEACPGTARRDVMGHLFCQLWRAASFLRSHLPFPGPAGIPDESPHRPLDLSNLSPQSLAPFHLFCPWHSHPGGISCRGGDRAWTLGISDLPFPRHPLFPRHVGAALGTGPRARPLPPSAGRSSAIAEEARSLSSAVQALQLSSGHPRTCRCAQLLWWESEVRLGG